MATDRLSDYFAKGGMVGWELGLLPCNALAIRPVPMMVIKVLK